MVLNQKITAVCNNSSKTFKMIISCLVCFIFGCLTVCSFLETTKLSVTDKSLEQIDFCRDNIILNIAILVLFVLVIFVLSKYILEKINTKIFAITLSIYTFALGLFWILSVRSSSAHDSYTLTSTAMNFANGNFSALNPDQRYFYNYPFQLGYVLLCQIVNTFWKNEKDYYLALQIINLIALIMIMLAIIFILKCVFKNKKVTNIAILLLFLCPQGIMFTTYAYGNLIGFAFSMWAVFFEIKYFQTEKKYLMIISALLIGISIAIKSNNMIVLVAMCIILFIKFLDSKKLWNLISIVICIVLGTSILNIVISGYEHKANVDLGSGVPKILWLNMGIHEADNGYGWYNGSYTINVYSNNNCDSKAATKDGIEQIKERLDYFSNNPDYMATFFSEKTLSEWNEPTYTSIWVSQTRGHTEEVPEFVNDVYNDSLGKSIAFYMNQYQQIIYLFAFISFALIYKKKDAMSYLVPLIILGGFLYHFLFEAKSQYVITYFIVLIPLSAYGLNYICEMDLLKKVKTILKLGASEDNEA